MKKSFRILKFKKDKPIFEVKDVSKSFNGRSILKKISIKVFPGELVSLFGPNGAGKSTLFNIAIGAENADAGDILINNKSILQIPIHLRTSQGLGYLPQTRSLFNMSTYDNLYGLCQLHIKDPQKQKENIVTKPSKSVTEKNKLSDNADDQKVASKENSSADIKVEENKELTSKNEVKTENK